MFRALTPLLVTAAALLLWPSIASAHSVGQVQTAKRISQQTVVLLDPQGNPTPGGMGTDTKAQVGDILTFVIQFTPVPNNATRGGGGYITEYVPANTEVVGVRLIDSDGKTVPPKRGGQYNDGYGPKNRHDEFDGMGLGQGSMSAHYADTGIFFSADTRTARNPANAFITIFNGIQMMPEPTGSGGLGDLLGTSGPYFSHNIWDLHQMDAFGSKSALISQDGRGNTPFEYGSAVAGPQTHYPYDFLPNASCSDGMDNDNDLATDYPADPDCASALDDDETAASDGPVGPWNRIRYAGSEIGTGGITDCVNCAADFVRVGVPTALGFDLTADTPLPANTNALRFAVGELIVGQEYFAEVSLRVTGLPLDPTMNQDVNCSEVFGGDAAMPQNGQDNTWRYFVPAPACVQLNLFFELSVDKILAVSGDTLTYRIEGKNLSVNTMTNVVISDEFDGGDVSFVQSTIGPAPTVGNGTLTWPAMTLLAGDAYTFEWQMLVTGNQKSTINRATYVSDQLVAPGFSTVALTTIEQIVVLELDMAVNPLTTTAGSNVTYTATLTNNGTGAADINGNSFIEIELPAGFSFCGTAQGCNQPTINAAGVADPAAGPNNSIVFSNGLVAIPANGGTMTLVFDATVSGGVAPGQYTVDLQTQLDDNGIGRDVELSAFDVAPLLVDAVQSDPPVVDAPLFAGGTAVTGTTSEGAGATVTVYVNGNSVTPVIAGAGGVYSAAVPTLYAGQHINAKAQSAGEIESDFSNPDVVVTGLGGVAACNDGLDNDGDGLTDFPDDPGCLSALDLDEADTPQCADGIDNDMDGDIDFPDDTSCSSFADNDESGPPACNDGVDNDGDGQIDFPDDPGCQDAADVSEADLAACANGLDDDNDGLVDYPNDPGCDDPYDDDETDMGAGTGGAGGMSGTGGGGGAGAAPGSGGAQNPPDPGGLTDEQAAGSDGGCGCTTVGQRDSRHGHGGRWGGLLLLLGVGLLRRRRRAA
jgi:uncharacterized repeat protein (TIGR01451 family)